MVLVLDEDHTHYSDTFRNIFESGALSKKKFLRGVGRYQDEEGWACPSDRVSLLSARMFE